MSGGALHLETPLLEALPLAARTGRRVLLKLESLQPSGSFKLRGLGRLCSHLVANEGARRLVASSGGNAGLAVAWAARRLGVAAHIVVPGSTPQVARERLRIFGASVEVHGAIWNEADALARGLATEPGSAYVPPFDHPLIWAGHATLVDELVVQLAALGLARPDAVVLSVGGGLMCGVLEGMHRHGWREVPLVAVETTGAASLQAAVTAGRPVALARIETLATTLGALQVAEEAFRWTLRHPVRLVQLEDRAALAACRRFADDHQLLVEPACGVALAALEEPSAAVALGDARVVVAVACGGSGVSLELLERWQRAQAPVQAG